MPSEADRLQSLQTSSAIFASADTETRYVALTAKRSMSPIRMARAT